MPCRGGGRSRNRPRGVSLNAAKVIAPRPPTEARVGDEHGDPPLRVALAQLNTVVGDIDGNAALHRRRTGRRGRGRRGRHAGPGARDHRATRRRTCCCGPRSRPPRARRSTAWPEGVRRGIAVVGFPDWDGDCHNAAAVLADGRVQAVYRKRFLPNYGVFDEARYFAAGDAPMVLEVFGLRIGLSVCEDIWYPNPVAADLAAARVDLVCCISASPYHRRQGRPARGDARHPRRRLRRRARLLQPGGRPGRARLRRALGGVRRDRRGARAGAPVRRAPAGRRHRPRGLGPAPAARAARPPPPGGAAPRDHAHRRAPAGAQRLAPPAAAAARRRRPPRRGRGVGGAAHRHRRLRRQERVPRRHHRPLGRHRLRPDRGARRRRARPRARHRRRPALGPLLAREPRRGAGAGRVARDPPGGAADRVRRGGLRGRPLGDVRRPSGRHHRGKPPGPRPRYSPHGVVEQARGAGAGHRQQERDLRRLLHPVRGHGRRVRPAARPVQDLGLPPRAVAQRIGGPSGHTRGDHPPSADGRAAPRPARLRQPAALRRARRASSRDTSRQGLEPAELASAGFPEAVVADVVRMVDRAEYKRRQGPVGIKITPRAFGKDRRMPITTRHA